VRAERDVQADVVEKVAASFLDRYVKRNVGPAWGCEIERLLKVEIIPRIGDRRLGQLKKSDVHNLLDAIVDRGSPITANRTFAVLRQLCNWATEREIIPSSPCDKIKSPAAEKSRDRVLDDNEIRLAWQAFGAVGWPFGAIGKLLLLTGARRDELASGRWNEIDLQAKTWTVAKERSKNGVAHEIPLSGAAVDVIRGLPRIGDKKHGYVFTTTGETPVSGFSKAKGVIHSTVFELLKVEAYGRGESPHHVATPAHWTFHDLRRTVATRLQKLGVKLEVTEAILNHRSGSRAGIVGVYQRYDYMAEKRVALDAWARDLNAIVGTTAASVAELAMVGA
jgi:integrase